MENFPWRKKGKEKDVFEFVFRWIGTPVCSLTALNVFLLDVFADRHTWTPSVLSLLSPLSSLSSLSLVVLSEDWICSLQRYMSSISSVCNTQRTLKPLALSDCLSRTDGKSIRTSEGTCSVSTHTHTHTHADPLRGMMIIITPLLVEVWDDLLCPSPGVLLLLLLLLLDWTSQRAKRARWGSLMDEVHLFMEEKLHSESRHECMNVCETNMQV